MRQEWVSVIFMWWKRFQPQTVQKLCCTLKDHHKQKHVRWAASNAPDLGSEIERFAANLKHKLTQQKAQKPPEDIVALYKEADALASNKKQRHRTLRRHEKREEEANPLVSGMDLDFPSGKHVEGSNERTNRYFKREAEDSRSRNWERRDVDESSEMNDLEEEADSSFKRQSSEELLRRIRQVSQGRVIKLPMTPPGPAMRARAPPGTTISSSIPFKDFNPQFHLTPVGEYLTQLGCSGAKFYRICERNPRGFHGSAPELQASVAAMRTLIDLSDEEVVELLCLAPILLSYSKAYVDERIRLIRKKLKLNKVDLKHVLMGCPPCFQEHFPTDFEAATSFLENELGIHMNKIRDWTINFPMFLSVATKEKLESVLGYFKKKFEFKSSHLVNALKREPRLVAGEIDRYQKTKNWLVKYGISNDDAKTMLQSSPEVLLYDLEDTIIRCLDWYHSLGYKRPHILKIVLKRPQVLAFNLRDAKECVRSLLALRFTREEVRVMIYRSPSILEVDMDSKEVQWKIEYMLDALGKSIKDLISFPEYVTCSFEDRIVARVEFLRQIGRLDCIAWPLKKLYGDEDQTFCVNHAHKPFDRYRSFLTDWQTNKSPVMMKWTTEQDNVRGELLAA